MCKQNGKQLKKSGTLPALSIKLYVLFDEQTIELDVLIILSNKRSQGFGSAILDSFTTLADKHNLVALVSPFTQYGATSLERLANFYSRFGFLSNQLNSYPEYYGHGMVRFPKTTASSHQQIKNLVSSDGNP